MPLVECLLTEFLFEGDLKTFLLSRRQMVSQNTKEAEDVSSAGLTQMALDVAYGLQYLSECKYVHRWDILHVAFSLDLASSIEYRT